MKTPIDILHNRMPGYMASFCLSLEEEIRSYPFGCGLKLKFEHDSQWNRLIVTVIASYVTKTLSFSMTHMLATEFLIQPEDSNLKTHLCSDILQHIALAR